MLKELTLATAVVSAASFITGFQDARATELQLAATSVTSSHATAMVRSMESQPATTVMTGEVVDAYEHGVLVSNKYESIFIAIPENEVGENASIPKVGSKITVYSYPTTNLRNEPDKKVVSYYSHGDNRFYVGAGMREEEYFSSLSAHSARLEGEEGQQTIGIHGIAERLNGREFMLMTDTGQYIVDVDGMEDNPLDETEGLRLKEGDRLYVTGDIDAGFMEGKEINARSIIALEEYSL